MIDRHASRYNHGQLSSYPSHTYSSLERELESRERSEKHSYREGEEMCDKLSPVGEEKQSRRTSKRIKKRKHMESSTSMNKSHNSHSNLETSRKLRKKKTKKLKFLSLKLGLTKKSKKKGKTNPSKQSKAKGADTMPLKEKKRAESPAGGEKEEEEQCDTVAGHLFNSANDSTISSIHGLPPSSSSSSFLRTAMKKGASEEEETTEEERWVSYSEVVVDEVMSRSGTPRCCGGDGNEGRSSLALKLDYEQVMEAWLDKGTLYVDGERPQTVPDLHASADVFSGGEEARSLRTVPESETTERLWREHREASLLRYKEKRQSRLFTKRIRYQVRKLNAEKRPRVKGRFVKRDDL